MRKWVIVTLTLSMALFAGCLVDGNDKKSSSMPVYEGFGNWPEYAGAWKSIGGAAGVKFRAWSFLNVTISNDGIFSGAYQRYRYDFTYNMSTAIGTVPVEVYNPAGNPKAARGAINFDSKTGVMSFEGIGETTFALEVLSSKEIAFVFPTGFTFTVANIQR
ncbi:MAG: hypothetical protein ACYC9O_03635 [Candidatus Latescibacterota bacterium]